MGRARNRWSLAAPIAASVALSAIFVARTAFVADGQLYFTLFDDAMISMRYARNLAGGHGLVWNAGQPPVEGYTNFLWTLWMALLHLLPVPESKIAALVMICGAVILAATIAVVRRIASALAPDSPRAVAIAAWLTALYYPLIYWTLRGMEVGLVTLTIAASALLAIRLADRLRTRELAALAILMALGVLTRPDVVVPCAVVAAFVIWNARAGDRRRIALVLGGAIAGTFALHTGFRLWYYGDPLPNTYYLKVTGAPLTARLERGLRALLGIGVLHLLVPIALAAGYPATRRPTPRPHRGALLLAALFLAACAYSASVGGDAWESMLYANRYLTPAAPGLLILTALALDQLLREGALSRRSTFAVAALFIVAAVLTAAAPLVTHGLPATPADERLRLARVAVTAAPLLILPFVARARAAAVAVLTLACVVAINGFGFAMWLNHNAFYADDDAWAARYGLVLRAATADDATIAVTWAGAIPYFSRRATIDLLGKSDRAVARLPRQPAAGFDPGHDKWDYRYSVGQLRPDLVAQLWHASDAERADIERSGYHALAPWVFVRADDARVQADLVRRIACVILQEDPFVLGSTTRTLPDSADLVARYCRE
jgi:hypothetical protein